MLNLDSGAAGDNIAHIFLRFTTFTMWCSVEAAYERGQEGLMGGG